MSVLSVNGLCKAYPAFRLKDVSFSLRPGKITGFIGRNGAGKSTTLKCLFDFVHPDSGSVEFFGMDFAQNQIAVKQQVGLVLGGVDYYLKKRLKTITAVTKGFYPGWDDAAYQGYMPMFGLDPGKTPAQLSAGMRIKYSLALALSHNARLLILDEPTSGLDPVSRDDLLEVFMALCDRGITILFSTHITSDLDKCADDIIYIKNGAVRANAPIKDFVQGYSVVSLPEGALPPDIQGRLIGRRRGKDGWSALIPTAHAAETGLPCSPADLEAIMVHMEKEEAQ